MHLVGLWPVLQPGGRFVSTVALLRPTGDRSAVIRFDDAEMLDRRDLRGIGELWTGTGRDGVVSSAHYRATEAGVRILEAGGNAVDAATATSFALAVVESAGSGIGGMAMMLVSPAGAHPIVLPGPCQAPRRAAPALVKASSRYSGYRAVATPAYVAVMDAAHRRHATLPLRDLLAPAIELARDGFAVTPMQAELRRSYDEKLETSDAGAFFPALPVGATFTQPALAGTLQRLADAGLRDFYDGDIAAAYAADMRAHDGFIDADDLAHVRPPDPVEPLTGRFGDATVWTPGAPAGGQTLLQMLNLFAATATDGFEPDTPDGAELLAAIIRRARADRRRYNKARPGDPDLADPAYAEAIKHELGVGETSHISTIDASGNAVAVTQSIERSFGAKVVTPSLGFLHNGYMKGFKVEAKDHPHYLRPGAVARSNAAPTILTDAQGPTIAIGSTGSERMLSGIFGVLVRLTVQDAFSAVAAPRLHATPDGELLLEADRFDRAILEHLEARGYRLNPLDPYAFKFGGLHLAVRDGDELMGVADPRRDGAATGFSAPNGPPTPPSVQV